jgi:hypothetical protein
MVTDTLGEDTQAALQAGKKVLFMPPLSVVDSSIPSGFTTIFWNTQWTRKQPPHTLGILCDPDHPALNKFPTDFHSNWQWWELITQSKFMILDELGAELRPLVQVIDDWNTNRKLGILFEAKVGKGKLVVCSMDLRNNLESRPAARQMLRSLLGYMDSTAFRPREELKIEDIQGLLKQPSLLQALGAKVMYADSEATGFEAGNAIDENPATIWHTAWEGNAPGYPHEMHIDLQRELEITGFRYLPRQDMRNGWIAEYEMYVSNSPQRWGKPAAQGIFGLNKELKKILFRRPVKGRYIRFVARKGIEGQMFASVAELEILTDNALPGR